MTTAAIAEANIKPSVTVRRLGRTDYPQCYEAMRRFTATRDVATDDELWLVEHAPVYTLGQAGRAEHLLRATAIPVVQIDRGGQITYHGPGQIVVYTLLDLKRRGMGVKSLVYRLEQSVIELLQSYGIVAERRAGAPGVYVDDAKIAALGLRVRDGRCYHGLALNVAMDLTPFADINPCGYQGLRTVDMASCGARCEPTEAGDALGRNLALAWGRARERHENLQPG